MNERLSAWRRSPHRTAGFGWMGVARQGLLAFVLVAVAGCGGGGSGGARPNDGGATGGDVSAPPVDVSPDVALPDDASTADASQECQPAPGPPELEVGTHEAGENSPAAFTVLEDGSPLQVVLGFQGAYMVVLGLRVRGDVPCHLRLAASLTAVEDGTVLAKFKYKKPKPFTPGGDGWIYIYNLFVVVEDWEPWVGKNVTVHAEVLTEGGDVLATVDRVVLLQGP